MLALTAVPTHAALGGDAASVEVDRVALRGRVAISAGAGYTLHEMTLPTRTVVRQYLSPEGKIFALSWHGPAAPDLQQTLGSYYATFRAAVDNAPRTHDHHHLFVEQAGLVVRSSGQMRLRHAFIYVPALVPQGVSLSDLN
jgi:hypothetical protein